jgi:sugar/nucleoside kinase (ribokinase family)
MAALLKNLPLAEALDFANTAARHALDVPGSRIDWNDFADLKSELNQTHSPGQ